MQFLQILALAGAVSAHAVQTVTSVATATAPVVVVDCTTAPPAAHTSSEWYNATRTIVVSAPPPHHPPANVTAGHGANSTWGSGSKPTGTKPVEVTGGAAATKASLAGLLGFAGVAMLVL